MKKFIFLFIGMIICMIFIPIITIEQGFNFENVKNFIFNEKKEHEVMSTCESSNNEFKVLDKATNEVFSIPEDKFIFSTVATEVPASFRDEAIKAQMVAAYTYFKNLQAKQKMHPSDELKGADFSVDSSKCKYFATDEKIHEKWGNNFDFYNDKFQRLLNEVFGQTLKYNGEYIEAMYHAISSGQTESVEDVFGGNNPYLKPVPSPGDTLANGYLTEKTLSIAEITEILKAKFPDEALDTNAVKSMFIAEKNDSGLIKKVSVATKTLTGREIRDLFSLRSSNFDIEITPDSVTFKVRGYGHCVGLSQYGAEYMAKQGADYKEILAWYYPGTELVKD